MPSPIAGTFSTNDFANTFGPGGGTAPTQGVSQTGTGTFLQGAGSNSGSYGLVGPQVPAAPAYHGIFSNVQNPDFHNTLNGSIPSTKTVGPDPTTFTPLSYGGKIYTNRAEYQNQLVADVKSAHDKSIASINQAHANGLIDFETKQKLIDQSRSNLQTQAKQALDQFTQGTQALGAGRDAALNSQGAYFSTIAPNASQSGEKVQADKTNAQYTQDLANATTANQNNQDQITQAQTGLDTQKGQLDTGLQDFNTSYQNSLQAADQNQTAGLDKVTNIGLDAQAAQAAYANSAATAGAPKLTSIDPVALTQNLAQYFVSAQQAGIPLDQAGASMTAQLKAQGFTDAQIAPYLQYAYGQVTDPNTPYGNKSYQNSLTLAHP